ncbi:hypothetical protein IWW38_004546 [Coemansia aciculifera]|uniref:Uncharacterized protein n=1 Tax=Coemansia aciculifera TaxID=417176 RepID=A0ACC1LXM9_9FUNG|nr:hypothetical protein IWW38_004546 [Coemansia aciculifera]
MSLLLKKPRLSDVNQSGVVRGCTLGVDTVIDMLPDIGAISAISAWAPNDVSPSGVARGNEAYIAVGTDTGCIMLINSSKSITTLEGSGGPAIQCLLVKDTTLKSTSSANTRPSFRPDVVACDSDGRVSVYAMGQMFARNTFSAPLSTIALDTNPNSPSAFIVGDLSGAVTACHAQEVLWRTQIAVQEPPSNSERIRSQPMDYLADPGISGVCAMQFPDNHGILTSYVLAANGSSKVQVLSRGHSVLSVPTPIPCSAISAGYFVDGMSSTCTSRSQAIVGDEAGRLYVLSNFELIPYAQLDYPITRLISIPLRLFADRHGVDLVVCATQSNSVYVLHDKQVVGIYSADFWPASVDVIGAFSATAGPCIVASQNDMSDGSSCAKAVHVIPIELDLE